VRPRNAVLLLLIGQLGGCFLPAAPFPSKLAVKQLEAAKKLKPALAEYDTLAALPVDCPVTPATDRQRDMACAQLWTYKASSCLKVRQDSVNAVPDGAGISAVEREARAKMVECALAASASAVAFLPLAPTGETGASALRILILRARTIELRRETRNAQEAVIDDAEIGAVAVQMTPLPDGPLPDGSPPDGAYYASYFLAGTAARNATKAGQAARFGPEADRPDAKASACSAAQGGLQVLPKSTLLRALDAPLTTRRNNLTRLATEFCS